jgi:pimeloyl-ACP methyl ester carboxylesterase
MYMIREGRRIAVEVTGEGPLLLAAPGMGDLRSQYRHVTPALVAAGYRVATVDLRGHGESDVGFDRYTPDAVAGDLLAVIDHLGARRAVILGNSCSAASAVYAAAVAPERVAGLVLVGPYARDLPGRSAAVMRWLGRWMLSGPWGRTGWISLYRSLFKGGTPTDHEEHVAAVRDAASGAERLRALREVGLSSKATCSEAAGQVKCPALVIMGSRDPDFPDPAAEATWLATSLRGRAVVQEGVGHYPHQERPEETARAILDFLAEDACRAASA